MLITLWSTSQLLAAQSLVTSDSGEAQIDSVQLVIEGDTLRFRRTYRPDVPLYQAVPDSSVKKSVLKTNKTLNQAESGLAATGSISRGIQVSSNASVSLQSSMYLKINGDLNEDYTVSGVLTEKTSPLQPIGNTRRLNDFDRVLIRISGPALDAAIGDIDLKRQTGIFGKLERSIEGLDFSGRSGLASMHTSLGFSYGKYHLQQIQGKDGKQGPYRLSGKNGEKFIIVLAGSEKVKVDDKLLQRGQNDDYIIDYNAAEIVFTQKHILSSNSRISIEFEYVPDIYLASYSFGKQLMSTGFSLGDKGKSPFFFSASWQQLKDDARNPLGNVEQAFLENIFSDLSDSTSTNLISSIQLDSLTGNYNLTADNILEYAGEGLGDYSAEFTFVGLETGAYRKVLDVLDDYFVYDTLVGEYSSSQRYFAPKSKSILSVEASARVSAFNLGMDLGLSHQINNLYASSNNTQTRKAWDIHFGTEQTQLGVLLGDKYLEKGFTTHDAIESLEYYRRWQLSPRILEEEHLNYGHIRLGELSGTMFRGEASQFERDGNTIGKQIHLDLKTNPQSPISLMLSSYMTDRMGDVSQQHDIKSKFVLGKMTTELRVSAEDGVGSTLYPTNDHLKTGAGLNYGWSATQKVAINYDQRQDYRLDEITQGSIFSRDNLSQWSDRRQDWSTEYSFSQLLNSQGQLQFKYREHQKDSSSITRYYLGNLKFSGNAFDNRIRFQEQIMIDEEHIPRYDYHYVEVDTGYGEYSYDPFIEDYIPVNGGRFIRQRIFSDIEEQVRKYENKSRLEYISKSYGKSGKRGFKGRLNTEQRVKLQVDTDARIQDQTLLASDLSYQTANDNLLQKLNYSGKSTENNSTLYSYGAEKSQFLLHEVNGDLVFSPKSRMRVAISYEGREREVDYNPLATESWVSYRPYLEHTYTFSATQKIMILAKYSQVEDLHLEEIYGEGYFVLDHRLRIKRRGSLQQKLALSKIDAEVTSIPYSVFSGRQPGDNWKYTLNSRYTFSNRFQISLNYSLQQRGQGEPEQFLRVEGRTHF